eukprot:g41266.t1
MIKLGRVQRRFTRILPDMELECMRLRVDLIEVYKIMMDIDRINGLNYVIEYQRDGGRDPMYECTLCDFTGYLRIFVSHLGGIKHRMNYMSREYPEMVKWDATKLKQEELCLIVKERAAIIEKLEGRRSIKDRNSAILIMSGPLGCTSAAV